MALSGLHSAPQWDVHMGLAAGGALAGLHADFTCVVTWTTSYPSLRVEQTGPSGQQLIGKVFTLV